MCGRCLLEIDQREIQRKGGLCVRYPTSYIIYSLLKEVAKRLGKKRLRVVDITYGEGRFHVIPRRRVEEFLVGVDIEVRNWIVRPDVFIPKPLQKRETLELLRKLGPYDVLIIDPPFNAHLTRGRERRPHYFQAFGQPLFLLEESYRIAHRLEVPYVIAHFNKRRFNTDCYEHVVEIEFKPMLGVSTDFVSYFWLSENVKIR